MVWAVTGWPLGANSPASGDAVSRLDLEWPRFAGVTGEARADDDEHKTKRGGDDAGGGRPGRGRAGDGVGPDLPAGAGAMLVPLRGQVRRGGQVRRYGDAAAQDTPDDSAQGRQVRCGKMRSQVRSPMRAQVRPAMRPEVCAAMRRQMRAARLAPSGKCGSEQETVHPARDVANVRADGACRTRLDAARRERMRRAVERLMDVLEEFAEQGRPPMADLLAEGPFLEWAHYPEDDLRDAASGIVAFYHAHSQEDRPAAENGHFHCFVEASRVRVGARAIRREAARVARPLCHLVGLSIDRHGIPTEIFATNQWVTGERLYAGGEVAPLLARFAAAPDDAPKILRWVCAIVTLLEPEIEELLLARDLRLGLDRPGARKRCADRAFDVVAARPIDIGRRIDEIMGD